MPVVALHKYMSKPRGSGLAKDSGIISQTIQKVSRASASNYRNSHEHISEQQATRSHHDNTNVGLLFPQPAERGAKLGQCDGNRAEISSRRFIPATRAHRKHSALGSRHLPLCKGSDEDQNAQ